MKRWLVAIVGMLVMIAIPFGDTAAKFYLWCKRS
jgi:hypothetical protein